MSANLDTKSSHVAEEQVVEYLHENPDFFSSHPDILAKMKLHHESGKAVSLIERQVSSLREQNIKLEKKLAELLENARVNDRLFNLTRRTINGLIEAEDLSDLADILYYHVKEEFGVPHAKLIIFSDNQTVDNVSNVALDHAKEKLGNYYDASRPECGRFNSALKVFLFGEEHASSVGSIAISILRDGGEPLGLLAIGHTDGEYFRSGSDTLFLSHLSEVLNRLIHKFV